MDPEGSIEMSRYDLGEFESASDCAFVAKQAVWVHGLMIAES